MPVSRSESPSRHETEGGSHPPSPKDLSLYFFFVSPLDSKTGGIDKRWTPELIRARGFTPISNYFLESYSALDPALSAREAMFIVHLLSFKWDEGSPFPSFGRLADLMGISVSAARAYARSIERKGYLKRQERRATTSLFLLDPLFKALELRLKTPKAADPADPTSARDGDSSA